ncbi:hypothetical protein DFH07DRAFT_918855 [Mycena maculata]|uniref:Uncharacterized protein n=1 Tax=Mycena maculata TaxID=230809 RepID=A0AAD7JCJ3_9AGAR|nr:hypothetical protein DFH07DRAFT_918855 [Mycena maculata]
MPDAAPSQPYTFPFSFRFPSALHIPRTPPAGQGTSNAPPRAPPAGKYTSRPPPAGQGSSRTPPAGQGSSHAPPAGQGTSRAPPAGQDTPPGPPPPPTTGSKRPRSGNASNDEQDPTTPRRRRTAYANKSTPKKPKQKEWSIPRKEVPEVAKGLQKAFNLHLRVSMNLLSQLAVPHRLSAEEMAPFEARFASAADVKAQVSHLVASAILPTNEIQQKVSAFLHSVKNMNSSIALDAARIGEQHIIVIFNAIANAGLHAFAPDVFGNVESMYNLLHEHLAIHTFRTVGIAFAYSGFNPITHPLFNDYNLLRSFYRSYIYGHMAEQARKEERDPGRVARDATNNDVYKRRDELKSQRAAQIADDCFDKHVALLADEVECHSDDDEPASGSTEYLIHEKEGRDAGVTTLFRILSERRDDAKSKTRRRGSWRPRTRTPKLGASAISRPLPTKVPIDYFSHEFFNKMSVRQRKTYMDNGVALPTADHCTKWEDIEKWKGLDREKFMTEYGNAKLALYKLPTEAELARLEQSKDDDDDDE